MATVKVKFRASSVATKEGTLFYQVIHKRIVRQIPPTGSQVLTTAAFSKTLSGSQKNR